MVREPMSDEPLLWFLGAMVVVFGLFCGAWVLVELIRALSGRRSVDEENERKPNP